MDVASLSPNQLAKRQLIIEESKAALVKLGLDGLTTRTLAENSSFSRGAIHYYFDSVEQIIDAAMESHLQSFVALLHETAQEHEDAQDRFWAVTERYLTFFADTPDLALLWFDYAIGSVQAGRPQAAIQIESTLRDLLGGLLRDCGVRNAEDRAEALLAFMLGATLRGVLHPGSTVTNLHAQLGVVSGLG